jgi:hypothetical protein
VETPRHTVIIMAARLSNANVDAYVTVNTPVDRSPDATLKM